MNKDVKMNDKNRRNALGGTYAVIQKEKQDIRQYMQAETLQKKTVVTQTLVACQPGVFTCEHQEMIASKTETNDKQKGQMRCELCKCMHTNTNRSVSGGG